MSAFSNHRRSIVAIGVFVTLLVGVMALLRACRESGGPIPPPIGVGCEDLFDRGRDKRFEGILSLDCPQATCGSNTAFINTFPVDGLHRGGCWNLRRTRLVPGSFRQGLSDCKVSAGVASIDAGRGGDGLDVLRAVNAGGADLCAGHDLVGATFEAEAWVPRRGLGGTSWGPERATIRISQRRKFDFTVDVRGDKARPIGYAYVLTPAHDANASLCDLANSEPWIADWADGELDGPSPPHGPPMYVGSPPPPPPRRDHLERPSAREAIVVPGLVFDQDGDPISHSGPTSGWFNLACGGGALAQEQFRQRHADDRDQDKDKRENDDGYARRRAAVRTAWIKAHTARYVDGVSFTTAGPTIEVVEPTAGDGYDCGDHGHGTVEAIWTENGASCLCHPRLWQAAMIVQPATGWKVGEHHDRAVCKDVPCDEELFKSELGLPACPPPDRGLWVSYAKNHGPERQ